MNPNLEYLVNEAIDCYEEQDGDLVLQNENIRRRDHLLNLIIDDFPISLRNHDISRTEFRRKLRQLIKTAKSSQDPLDYFEQEHQNLLSQILSQQQDTYTIAFPLNITDTPFDELRLRGESFNRLSMSDWDSRFWNSALGKNDFQDVYKEVQTKKEPWQTFWFIEIDAVSEQAAIEYMQNLLEVVLGQLQYCIHHWTKRTVRSGFSIEQYGWSELRNPFIYILQKNGSYESTYYDEDIRERERIMATPRVKRRLEREYAQIPEFTNPNEVEEEILNAFRGYHEAVTEPNGRRAFLDYWRTLESLALVDPEDSTRTVLERGTAVAIFDREQGFDENFGLNGLESYMTDRLSMLRNQLSHETSPPTVHEKDMEYLRCLFHNLAKFMIINRKWDKEKVIFWMENSTKDHFTQSIQDRTERISQLEQERHLLKSIERSQKYR